MARKSGSAKKAARRAKERQDSGQSETTEQTEALEQLSKAPALAKQPTVVEHLASPEQPSTAEQQAAASADDNLSSNETTVLPIISKQRSRGALLCDSINQTLNLLHEYQQYRYHKGRLYQTELELFRECKSRLWETHDCVPEYDRWDTYV